MKSFKTRVITILISVALAVTFCVPYIQNETVESISNLNETAFIEYFNENGSIEQIMPSENLIFGFELAQSTARDSAISYDDAYGFEYRMYGKPHTQNSIVITIMGDGFDNSDGYTTSGKYGIEVSAEQEIFFSRAEKIANELTTIYPFSLFKERITVYAIGVISDKSYSVSNDKNFNYFGTYVSGADGKPRVQYMDTETNITKAENLRLSFFNSLGINGDNGYLSIILLNSTSPSGGVANYSKGNFAVSTIGSEQVADVLAHELGHSFSNLRDEYYKSDSLHEYPNHSRTTSHDDVKWKPWIWVDGIGTYSYYSANQYSGDTPTNLEQYPWTTPLEQFFSTSPAWGVYNEHGERLSSCSIENSFCGQHGKNHCKMANSSYPFCNVCASEITRRLATITKEDFYGYVPDKIDNLGKAVISTETTRILDYAFWGRDDLTDIAIPNTVKTIGRYSFLRCTGLTKVDIPPSVMYIDPTAFYGCDNVQINLPVVYPLNSAKYSVLYGGNGEDVFDVARAKKSLLNN